MRILGIDPGLHVTGYGLIEMVETKPRLLEAGIIKTDEKALLEARLLTLYEGLTAVMQEWRPDGLAVEELYAKYNHPRTAILMGHARGTIFLVAGQQGVPVCGYEATLVKRALTGNGRADKAQVARMVCQLLNLPEPPSPPDVTDALALALCHASPLRQMLVGRRRSIAALGGSR